jgi:hypothetical protein
MFADVHVLSLAVYLRCVVTLLYAFALTPTNPSLNPGTPFLLFHILSSVLTYLSLMYHLTAPLCLPRLPVEVPAPHTPFFFVALFSGRPLIPLLTAVPPL